MGKTAIGVDIAWNIASKQNNQHKPVFFFSLEMDRKQLARRLTTRLSGVERLKTPKLMSNNDWIQVSMAMETSEESKLYICDHSQMDMFDITGSIRRLIARTGERPGA
ncbi:MAG: DnaB-like helicase C-terminal domain-containing protein, partial [Dolichospermum sp.]